MATPLYPRMIDFEAVLGFRDLSGYRTASGNTVAWRRLFRSGELQRMTDNDLAILKKETGLAAAIDLRSNREVIEQRQEIDLLKRIGSNYFCASYY